MAVMQKKLTRSMEPGTKLGAQPVPSKVIPSQVLSNREKQRSINYFRSDRYRCAGGLFLQGNGAIRYR